MDPPPPASEMQREEASAEYGLAPALFQIHGTHSFDSVVDTLAPADRSLRAQLARLAITGSKLPFWTIGHAFEILNLKS